MSSPSSTFTYFHAGALFTLKDLAGNALLAEVIQRESSGRFHAILPQDLEVDPLRTSALRDADLLALLSADVALFHFDGPELDSGTVVEFMVAKFADIPAVIVRSDFRRGGDNHADAWNLMLSDYPRTRQVIVHAMELYHGARHPDHGLHAAADRATEFLARQVITAFDEVRALPSVLPVAEREAVYRWLPVFAGLVQPEVRQRVQDLLAAKIAKGLL